MLVYFDTEFEGLYKDAKLISIGLVADDGRELYCELADIDVTKQNEWIVDNVLANTALYSNQVGDYKSIADFINNKCSFVEDITDPSNYFCGYKQEVADKIKNWLSVYDEVQLVSDVSHYDMVQFIDLFEEAFKLPDNICAYCHDINQDIASYLNISDKQAFDYSREQILFDNGMAITGKKHNSLYDAHVIKSIYKIVNKK